LCACCLGRLRPPLRFEFVLERELHEPRPAINKDPFSQRHLPRTTASAAAAAPATATRERFLVTRHKSTTTTTTTITIRFIRIIIIIAITAP
jgi:hypothetical protein